MNARRYYVIVDTVNECIVMVRPDENTVDVVNGSQAAAVADILLGNDENEAVEEAKERLEGLSLAALAARLCTVSEDIIEGIVAASKNNADHAANGVCISIGVAGGTTVTFRADR